MAIRCRCEDCGVEGVRLYRRYQSSADAAHLRCTACALKEQGMEKPDSKTSIGWLVAAVPTVDGETFWGYTSVPQERANWWHALPAHPPPPPPAKEPTR